MALGKFGTSGFWCKHNAVKFTLFYNQRVKQYWLRNWWQKFNQVFLIFRNNMHFDYRENWRRIAFSNFSAQWCSDSRNIPSALSLNDVLAKGIFRTSVQNEFSRHSIFKKRWIFWCFRPIRVFKNAETPWIFLWNNLPMKWKALDLDGRSQLGKSRRVLRILQLMVTIPTKRRKSMKPRSDDLLQIENHQLKLWCLKTACIFAENGRSQLGKSRRVLRILQLMITIPTKRSKSMKPRSDDLLQRENHQLKLWCLKTAYIFAENRFWMSSKILTSWIFLFLNINQWIRLWLKKYIQFFEQAFVD